MKGNKFLKWQEDFALGGVRKNFLSHRTLWEAVKLNIMAPVQRSVDSRNWTEKWTLKDRRGLGDYSIGLHMRTKLLYNICNHNGNHSCLAYWLWKVWHCLEVFCATTKLIWWRCFASLSEKFQSRPTANIHTYTVSQCILKNRDIFHHYYRAKYCSNYRGMMLCNWVQADFLQPGITT